MTNCGVVMRMSAAHMPTASPATARANAYTATTHSVAVRADGSRASSRSPPLPRTSTLAAPIQEKRGGLVGMCKPLRSGSTQPHPAMMS
jgi:hypothetical protein